MVSRSTPLPPWPRSRCWMRRRLRESQARPDRPGLSSHIAFSSEVGTGSRKENASNEKKSPVLIQSGPGSATTLALLLGRGGRRRLVVVLGFRIEELAGGGDRFGGRILIFLTGRNVFAAVDALGFIGAARDGDADADFDFRVHGDGDLVLADGLDRCVQHDLAAVDGELVGFERRDDVAN